MGDVRGATHNNASEAGNVVQAQNVHGDVHVHDHSGSTSARVVPRQLPAAAVHFINRTVEQDALTTLLHSTGADHTVLVSTVDGLAGVGKSTLVVQWAHQVREQFPDGELHVNLRGFDPAAEPVTAAEALAGFLAALGVAPEAMPAGEDARAAHFRTLVHGRRMLLVLDNARDTQQVLPLLPGTPGCLVLVTGRQRLDGLVAQHGAHRLELATLTREEGHQVLAHHLGEQRLAAEPEAAAVMLQHCAGLPLALTLVGVQAAAEPDVPLSDLAADLSDERDRLDALDAGGATGIRAVFSWSYRTVSAEAARMFRLLGLPTSPDISAAAAAALAGIEQRRARRVLAELSRAQLITRSAGDRYTFHDLLRAYARERAHAEDTEAERTEALQRLLDHHLYATYAANQLLAPTRILPELDRSEEQLRHDFTTYEDALAWWDAEHANVLATIRQAAALHMPRGPWLAHLATYPFKLRGLLEDLKRSCSDSLASAEENGDRSVRARLHVDLGTAHLLRQDFEAAIHHQHLAGRLFAELGEPEWEALTHATLGEVHLELGQHANAEASVRHELAIHERFGTREAAPGHADIVLGVALAHRGDHSTALRHLHRGVDVNSDQFLHGYALTSLGSVHLAAGNIDEAISTCRSAVEHRQNIGDRLGEATGLDELGGALRASGDVEGTREVWQRALAVLDELGHPDAGSVRDKLDDLDSADGDPTTDER